MYKAFDGWQQIQKTHTVCSMQTTKQQAPLRCYPSDLFQNQPPTRHEAYATMILATTERARAARHFQGEQPPSLAGPQRAVDGISG